MSGVQVKFSVSYNHVDEEGGPPYVATPEVYGTTNTSGGFTLSIQVEYATFLGLVSMSASVTDSRYVTLSASGNYSTSGTTIYPSFTVILDTDRDGIDDNVEWQIAEKFKPVLHKHSYDKQQGLANFNEVLINYSTLIVIAFDGRTVYSDDVPPIHVWSSEGDWCSFGRGIGDVELMLDFNDNIRHTGATAGSRPLYYHVYRNGDYYYLQYWYFFTFNDLRDYTDNHTWHEGDWEHVALKLRSENGIFKPVAVNFYQHDGGHTKYPRDCWWSPAYANTYTYLQQGYDEGHTHLHVWIAANSHASYNRFDKVYDYTLNNPELAEFGIVIDHFKDNCDYNPSGWNLYFPYDYLENLGEVVEGFNVTRHKHLYPYHIDPLGNSKEWLAFYWYMGDWWSISIGPLKRICTYSPFSPAVGKTHEYYGFSEDYSVWGFGNEQSRGDGFFTHGITQWLIDSPDGD